MYIAKGNTNRAISVLQHHRKLNILSSHPVLTWLTQNFSKIITMIYVKKESLGNERNFHL